MVDDIQEIHWSKLGENKIPIPLYLYTSVRCPQDQSLESTNCYQMTTVLCASQKAYKFKTP